MSHRIGAQKCRGFTLTEIAIVLGIIGLVLGAIWTAASSVYASKRTQVATSEITQIVNGYKAFYAMHGIDVPDPTDVTCTGVSASLFPAEMIPSGFACSGTTLPNPNHPVAPWAGVYVTVTAKQNWPGLIVDLNPVTPTICNNVMDAVTFLPGVIYESINVTSQLFAPFGTATSLWTAAQINTLCSAGGTDIQIGFKIK